MRALLVLLGLLTGQVSIAQTCNTEFRDSMINAANSECSCSHVPGCSWFLINRVGPNTLPGSSFVTMDCSQTQNGFTTIFGTGKWYGTCSTTSSYAAPPLSSPKCNNACCGQSGNLSASTENKKGSIISIDSQSLGEVIQLVGVPYNLVYSSDLVKDKAQYYRAVLRVSDSEISATATGFNIKIYNEANQVVVNQNYGASPDIFHTFIVTLPSYQCQTKYLTY